MINPLANQAAWVSVKHNATYFRQLVALICTGQFTNLLRYKVLMTIRILCPLKEGLCAAGGSPKTTRAPAGVILHDLGLCDVSKLAKVLPKVVCSRKYQQSTYQHA